MRILAGAILAIALAGCASAPSYPSARPLTQTHIDQMRATPVVVSENNFGVEKAWFYTSTASAGAAYGFIGALVTATMDAIINAGPSRRARKAADEIAELMPAEALNASLVAQVQAQLPNLQAAVVMPAVVVVDPAPPAPPAGVYYESVVSAQRLGVEAPLEDAVLIDTSYTLSEDASTLRVIATASYQSAQTPYVTRTNSKAHLRGQSWKGRPTETVLRSTRVNWRCRR